jgi:hypothetical protein
MSASAQSFHSSWIKMLTLKSIVSFSRRHQVVLERGLVHALSKSCKALYPRSLPAAIWRFSRSFSGSRRLPKTTKLPWHFARISSAQVQAEEHMLLLDLSSKGQSGDLCIVCVCGVHIRLHEGFVACDFRFGYIDADSKFWNKKMAVHSTAILNPSSSRKIHKRRAKQDSKHIAGKY